MDPIENAVGALGKWQIMVSLLIFLSRFPVAFLHMAIIFIAPPVSYDCVTPRNLSACAPECKEVQFDHSIFEETITTEWKLICNKEHLANLSQTISMLGILLGNLLISMWADRYAVTCCTTEASQCRMQSELCNIETLIGLDEGFLLFCASWLN